MEGVFRGKVQRLFSYRRKSYSWVAGIIHIGLKQCILFCNAIHIGEHTCKNVVVVCSGLTSLSTFFSVISRWCLVATGSSMLTFIVLPH